MNANTPKISTLRCVSAETLGEFNEITNNYYSIGWEPTSAPFMGSENKHGTNRPVYVQQFVFEPEEARPEPQEE